MESSSSSGAKYNVEDSNGNDGDSASGYDPAVGTGNAYATGESDYVVETGAGGDREEYSTLSSSYVENDGTGTLEAGESAYTEPKAATWTAYMDQETGAPYYVCNETGMNTWVAPEDYNFEWADHDDDLSIKRYQSVMHDVNENLGPDYDLTPWVCPSFEVAQKSRQKLLFAQGKASVCALNSKSLGKLGVGVQLYSELVQSYSAMLLFCGLLSIPALSSYSNGTGLPESEIDFPFRFASFTPGMLSTSLSSSESSEREGVSMFISLLDLLVSVFLAATYVYLKPHISTVNDRTDCKETTTSDFAIYVKSGLPTDSSEKEVLEHFSSIFQLGSPDFRGRAPLKMSDKSHCSVERDGLVYPVGDVEHIDGDEKYIGKWVAEVAMVKNNGESLISYLGLTEMQKKIRHGRAKVKRYSEGTPHPKGPSDRKKYWAELKLAELENDEENALKGIKEDERTIGAFVVFDHEESFLRCVEDYRLQENQRHCSCCTRCHRDVSHLLFRGKHRIHVERAADAADVQFEYLSSQGHLRKRRLISRCTILGIILLSFVFVWGLQLLKRSIDKQSPDTSICSDPGLGKAVFGKNHTFGRFKGSRDIKKDPLCQKKTGDDTSYYLTINGLLYDQSSLAGNSSICSPSVHSCLPGEVDVKGNKTLSLCPCSSATSKSLCVNAVDKSKYVASTVVACYCFDALNKVLAGGTSSIAEFLYENEEICGTVVYHIAQSRLVQQFSSILVAVINIGITMAITWLVHKERHSKRSEEDSQVVLLSLAGQFLNTTLVIILIYMKIPGINVPFLFEGEYSSLSAGWYSAVAVFIQMTMLISTVSSHAKTLLIHGVLLPCTRKRAKKHPERYLTQQEMNEAINGEVWHMEERAADQLLLFAVPVVFSPGMPMLLFIGAFGLIVGDFVDKYELARLSPHPPPQDSSTPKVMVRILPYLVLMRLLFATLVFSNSEIFRTSESAYFNSYSTQYKSLGILRGISSEASIYHFIVLVVLLALLLFRAFLWPFIEGSFHIIEETLESLSCCCKCCKHSLRTARSRIGKSAFTEYYCERWDKDFSPNIATMCSRKPKMHKLRRKESGPLRIPVFSPLVQKLSALEKILGWKIVNEDTHPKHTEDVSAPKPHYKVKAWMTEGTVKKVTHSKGQLKRTWEVIQENGPSSYRLEKQVRYEIINQLREEKKNTVMLEGKSKHKSQREITVRRTEESRNSSDSDSSGSDSD